MEQPKTEYTLVAIESPLAGDFERNRRYALWCAYDCYRRGEAAYASHLIFTQFLNDENPAQRAFGIAAGLAWASCCDVRAFYTDLGMSPGMKRGQVDAVARGYARIEERKLSPIMLDAFEEGLVPSATPGFK